MLSRIIRCILLSASPLWVQWRATARCPSPGLSRYSLRLACCRLEVAHVCYGRLPYIMVYIWDKACMPPPYLRPALGPAGVSGVKKSRPWSAETTVRLRRPNVTPLTCIY